MGFLLGNIRLKGVGSCGRWVVWALGRQGVGSCGRWVFWGDDDEVSGQDTLQGASVRYPKAPLKLASRSVGVHFHFLGVGSPGRWVVWALGARQGHPRVVDDEVTLPELR